MAAWSSRIALFVAIVAAVGGCRDEKAWPKSFSKGLVEQCVANGLEPATCQCRLEETRRRIPWPEMKSFMEKVASKTPTSADEVRALDGETTAKLAAAESACAQDPAAALE